MVNATNLYEKVRGWLDNIPNDASGDQSRGHKFAKQMSARLIGPPLELESSVPYCYSTDLSSFTDKLNWNAYTPFLEAINCRDFLAIVNSPIVVGKEVVEPLRLLMGLRGTFELASLIHHGIVRQFTKNYVLCGDDLLFLGVESDLVQYRTLCDYVGLELNQSKTVVSIDTTVFCGKVYFRGTDVSPISPPIFSLTKDFSTFISSARNFMENGLIHEKAIKSRIKIFLKYLGRLYRGKIIPYELPIKLGGIGFKTGRSLIRILERKAIRSFARFPTEDDEPPPRYTRRYPISTDKDEVKLFPYTRNLLLRGYVLRRPSIKPKHQTHALKDMHSCLCYFYDLQPYHR
jgi:hypothetical protein